MEKTFIYNPEEFNFSCRLFSVESFIRLFNQNHLILDECRWSTRQCSLFIESILIRIPLDLFYIDRTSEKYKIIREENIQEDYKYSILNKYNFIQLSDDFVILDAHYSRYNSKYKKIFFGRGLYSYKRVNTKWKLFEVNSF